MLLLAHREVATVLKHQLVELPFQCSDEMLESRDFQGMPQGVVLVHTEGVEVVAESASDELRLLRHDRQVTAQVLDANRSNIDAIDHNIPLRSWRECVESRDEGALAAA